jgi:hypothetical protein
MTSFASLMRRADYLLRGETDPVKSEWWQGYKRGLRRAHHGASFGTDTEHQLYLDAAASDDPMRQARGKGYVAGLTLEPRDPPDSGAERAARYKASGRQIACVIRDPAALAALDRLADKHGGVTAAVTAALLASSKSSSRNAP